MKQNQKINSKAKRVWGFQDRDSPDGQKKPADFSTRNQKPQAMREHQKVGVQMRQTTRRGERGKWEGRCGNYTVGVAVGN